MYGSWDMVDDRWTDGQMDGKWHIEVGAPPKKSIFRTECNSLWDEKQKEKEIVNQIVLSKLWYIGQIYTIPKFVNKKIEKKIAIVGKGVHTPNFSRSTPLF